MILDGILNILGVLFNILLAPLEVINIGIDIVSSVPIVASFIQVVAYIFPFQNLLPIIIITIAILGFKIVISIIKTLWDLLPIL